MITLNLLRAPRPRRFSIRQPIAMLAGRLRRVALLCLFVAVAGFIVAVPTVIVQVPTLAARFGLGSSAVGFTLAACALSLDRSAAERRAFAASPSEFVEAATWLIGASLLLATSGGLASLDPAEIANAISVDSATVVVSLPQFMGRVGVVAGSLGLLLGVLLAGTEVWAAARLPRLRPRSDADQFVVDRYCALAGTILPEFFKRRGRTVAVRTTPRNLLLTEESGDELRIIEFPLPDAFWSPTRVSNLEAGLRPIAEQYLEAFPNPPRGGGNRESTFSETRWSLRSQ